MLNAEVRVPNTGQAVLTDSNGEFVLPSVTGHAVVPRRVYAANLGLINSGHNGFRRSRLKQHCAVSEDARRRYVMGKPLRNGQRSVTIPQFGDTKARFISPVAAPSSRERARPDAMCGAATHTTALGATGGTRLQTCRAASTA